MTLAELTPADIHLGTALIALAAGAVAGYALRASIARQDAAEHAHTKAIADIRADAIHAVRAVAADLRRDLPYGLGRSQDRRSAADDIDRALRPHLAAERAATQEATDA